MKTIKFILLFIVLLIGICSIPVALYYMPTFGLLSLAYLFGDVITCTLIFEHLKENA